MGRVVSEDLKGAAESGLRHSIRLLEPAAAPDLLAQVAAFLHSLAFGDLLTRLLDGNACVAETEVMGFDVRTLPPLPAPVSVPGLLCTLLQDALAVALEPAAEPPEAAPEAPPAPELPFRSGYPIPAAGEDEFGSLPAPPLPPGGGRPSRPEPETSIPSFSLSQPIEPNFCVIPVHYATDRARSEVKGEHYSGRRGTLGFGVAEVSIPRRHRVGRLESPKWWRLEFAADPGKHVIVQQVTPMEEDKLLDRLRACLGESQRREVLVFVHGYNVTFSDAARRAAQLAYDLHFPGVTALYSWPSEGRVEGYMVDEANVGWTVPHFQHFLTLLLAQSGAETVHVIAHSMGNRALVEALRSFDPAALPAGSARLRQVIFAAPDVDAGTFRQLAAQFHGRAERFTLYASSEDLALQLSRQVHGYPRAGQSGEHLTLVAGVDTIDATAVNTSLLGHSEYGDNRSILVDLFTLLREGKAPDQRFGLDERHHPSGRYWWCRP